MLTAAATVLAASTFAGPVRASSVAVDPACAVPDSVFSSGESLPRATARLAAGRPLSVLIVHSGKQAPKPGVVGYPARLEEELKRRLPGRAVRVAVLGLPGEAAPAMVAPLAQAVEDQRPALVVWQTGTVDAMRNLDPESFGTALQAGIAEVHRRGADIVIMDMQYSMHTAQLIDFAPYLSYIAWLAQGSDVFHFPRYDIMRRWVEEERVDFADEREEAKRRSYDFVHQCIGQLLAESIATMIAPPVAVPPAMARSNGPSH
ncbi:MAG: SGNH/GDSL hydrolase family protein [Alphaproteobacteria bacterium]